MHPEPAEGACRRSLPKELVEGPGDVPTTYADATALERDFGFTPKITLREGLRHFVHPDAS